MTTVPQIDVLQLAEKLAQRRNGGPSFILLDVRESLEWQYARLGDEAEISPVSDLAARGTEALPPAVLADKETEIIVMCHHGIRSAQVTGWLRQQGWQNVYNLTGGINDYALIVDPSIGHY